VQLGDGLLRVVDLKLDAVLGDRLLSASGVPIATISPLSMIARRSQFSASSM
jgi:hypothetical protein